MTSSDDAQVASSALTIPPRQFKQHGPQQGVIGQASHTGGFGNRADKRRRVAPLRCPAEPAAEFEVGVWGVHPGE